MRTFWELKIYFGNIERWACCPKEGHICNYHTDICNKFLKWVNCSELNYGSCKRSSHGIITSAFSSIFQYVRDFYFLLVLASILAPNFRALVYGWASTVIFILLLCDDFWLRPVSSWRSRPIEIIFVEPKTDGPFWNWLKFSNVWWCWWWLRQRNRRVWIQGA